MSDFFFGFSFGTWLTIMGCFLFGVLLARRNAEKRIKTAKETYQKRLKQATKAYGENIALEREALKEAKTKEREQEEQG